MKYFLSIDCGLTKIKIVFYTQKGETVYENSANTPLVEYKIDTVNLYNKLVSLICGAFNTDTVKPENIIAVSVSGHGNGLYIIDNTGVYPFGFSSMFNSGKMEYPETQKTFPITMQSSWGGQPLAILKFLKQNDREIFGSIKKIAFCKDIIRYFITGKIYTDYSDASAAGLLNYKTGNYDSKLMDLYGLGDNMDILPELCRSDSIVGTVSKDFAKVTGLLTDTPVIGGLFDVNSCMLGVGAIHSDTYCIIAGTWGINASVVDFPVLSNKITQCCNFCYPDKYVCIDSAPTSCVNLEWFLNNVLRQNSYSDADVLVQNCKFDLDLFYFPYIYLSMDIGVKGGFYGLNATHDYRDLLRAVFEGIVFEHTYRIEKLRETGIEHNKVILAGGAANSSVFCQMFADTLGMEVHITSQSQTGALGSAIMSSVAVGIYSDIDEAVQNMVKEKAVYKPKKETQLHQKYIKFKKYLDILKEMGVVKNGL